MKFHNNHACKIFEALEIVEPILPTPFYWMDADGVVLGINELCLKAIGSSREIIGKKPYEFYKKEIAEHILKHNAEVIKTGEILSQEEWIEDITTKKIKCFSSIKSPLYDDQGTIIGIIGSSVEITAEKEAERLKAEIARQEVERLKLDNELQKQLLHEQEKLTKLATQVAHDIRSPLAALNTVLKYLTEVPENQRIMMRNAANRINDIANNLLSHHKAKQTNSETADNKQKNTWLIAPLIESMISEKRLQFEGSALVLDADISTEGFAAFATFNACEMKRLLSNLINNAFEAFAGRDGKIIVTLQADETEVIIQVQDNGIGIPQDKIAQVISGISLKTQGHGLGLSHAKQYIESLNGQFILSSTENVGTTLELRLPRSSAPSWFVSEIVISHDQPIAILDDDQSVHNAWDQRLTQVSRELNIHHFFNTTALKEWYQTQKTPVQILSDYELLGEPNTGLDALETLNIAQRGILVTSHYENPDIINRCQAAGIRLLPKNLLAHVPIKLKQPTKPTLQYDAILIDDDETLRMSWAFVAQLKHKKLLTLESKHAFEAIIDQITKDTLIYIDSELGDHKGEVYAKTLFERGFTNLYLATGHPASHFSEMPWIKGIAGKEPPL